ncbi:MAG: hypothetical protein AAGD00_11110 [Planctomycetota bacterium]
MNPSKPMLCLLLLASLLALPGCQGATRDALGRGATYADPPLESRSVNIQVFRQAAKLTFSNTTPNTLPAGRLWVNGQFGYEIGETAVGQSRTLPLNLFENEFGDRFRAGGFFATEPPSRLVLVELESGGELIGFTIGQDDPDA